MLGCMPGPGNGIGCAWLGEKAMDDGGGGASPGTGVAAPDRTDIGDRALSSTEVDVGGPNC